MDKEKKSTSGQDWEELGFAVWERTRRKLFLSMPYMSGALSLMKTVPDGRIAFTATDGENIYFNPMLFVKKYKEDPVYVNRAYMHMILHCMFFAPFKNAGELIKKAVSAFERSNGGEHGRFKDTGDKNEPDSQEIYLLFDLAADIYAEYIIDGLDTQALRMPESDVRNNIYTELKRKCSVLSIENIMREIVRKDPADIAGWEEIFRVDDHSFWQGRENANNNSDDKKEDGNKENDNEEKDSGTEKRWESAAGALGTAIVAYGSGKGETRLLKGLETESRRKISYRDFLMKYMRIRESRRTDPDSFDPGFYNYGMSVYGDMPLVEELETKEEKQLGELFIAIDTSGSCSGGLIERFLEETMEILSVKGIFHGTDGVRLILCDNEIRGEYRLEPGDDPDKIRKNIKINGLGGTDFRPVFSYIRKQREKGRAKKISGLIYFTDGYGIYPKERPGWKTAFVFAKEPDFNSNERIIKGAGITGRELLRPPSWAMTNIFSD